MSKWEKKFGKYAISNLTLILIICYGVGYLLTFFAKGFMNYLTLDTYAVLHGQVWRLVTWLIVPPSSFDSSFDIFITIIMLLFYWSLGTQLERVWGVWRYNVYIFTGIFLTILGAFLSMGIYYLIYPEINKPEILFSLGSWYYSTYYVNMSIFLAYAFTFPNNQVLLMFVIPVKIKWLGIIYGLVLVLNLGSAFWQGIGTTNSQPFAWFQVAAIGASLLNFLIFYLRTKNHMHLNPKQIRRRAEFRQDIRRNPKITKHKCAVCGRTDEDDPDLEFRFCSKCNGNYEYCQHHLFTHTHVK